MKPTIVSFARAVATILAGTASLLPAQASAAAPSPVWVGRFADGLDPWREVRLREDLARNRFELRMWDDAHALQVSSQASMSLLARPVSIDLADTPVLCWRWRIDAPLKGADIATRAGDDYAARLYVSFAIPDEEKGFGLRTRLALGRAIWGADLPDAAINYVWDNRSPVGTEQANAYTDRAMMVVLRSGATQAGRWVSERRDIAADVTRLFSPRAAAVQLAVTADTDNTGESATAGFADLHFVARNQPCALPR